MRPRPYAGVETFIPYMSYMRTLEGLLNRDGEVEAAIPFWEFLDVEFDPPNKTFILSSYYTQLPSFPHLFARLVGSREGCMRHSKLAGLRSVRWE